MESYRPSWNPDKAHRVIMIGPKEYWYEGKPHNAGGVHGEPNVLGLVEVWWNLPGLDCIHSAEQNQYHVVYLV